MEYLPRTKLCRLVLILPNRVTVQTFVIIFLLLTSSSLGCGPGRGSGRRRGPRKMTPLVFKQHIPNVSENTLGASGRSLGKIMRDNDKKFNELVVNNNKEILFKDEEGTGSDRMMSQRCRDSLDSLSISVMNQWPGVRLRVTEAWDEDGHHTKNSLHYEGRAVDITTSDRDRTKYGMLARLAVEAGFDWVYFESRGHIHCSVKSDSSMASRIGGCFPEQSQVVMESGESQPLSALQAGDSVLSLCDSGLLEYSEVIAFLDRDTQSSILFTTIVTAQNDEITLTPKHHIYVHNTNMSAERINMEDLRVKFADSVVVGEYIYVWDGSDVPKLSQVKKIFHKTWTGFSAPLTKCGTVIVDGILASCYAYVNDVSLAHSSFGPMRFMHSLSSYLPHEWRTWYNFGHQDGVHWYADILYKVALQIYDSDFLIRLT